MSGLEEMNCSCSCTENTICFSAGKPLHAVRCLKTMPYPGFPTDVQAIMMAVLCRAEGTSVIEETIFENRFRHVDAFVKMGADIQIAGRAAVIHGVKQLQVGHRTRVALGRTGFLHPLSRYLAIRKSR